MKKLKGKNLFTQKEINELKRLITLRVNSTNKSEKKKLRDKMREIGFYGGDDWGINDCQIADLERLVSERRIKVISNNLISKSEYNSNTVEPAKEKIATDLVSVEEELIKGDFKSVSSLSADAIPNEAGIYCIKLREGSTLPSKFGKIREDRIIYIGKASTSLRKRLWEEELNHKKAATFFRSIGAMLNYLPKGSFGGKPSNYKFSNEDTDAIRKWMKQSLRVNFIKVKETEIINIEDSLIKKYTPLVNISKNPKASEELKNARLHCIDYVKKL